MRQAAFGQHKSSLLDRVIAYVRLDKVKRMIPSGGRVLDLGCGYNGELVESLRSQWQATGMDLQVNPNNKNLMQGRVDARLPFADASFEVVTALAIIEHVEDPTCMLGEIKRVLKLGGVAIITTPSSRGKLPLEIMARLGMISKTEIDDHKKYYTRETLRTAMTEAGLRDVVVEQFGILWLNLIAKGIK